MNVAESDASVVLNLIVALASLWPDKGERLARLRPPVAAAAEGGLKPKVSRRKQTDTDRREAARERRASKMQLAKDSLGHRMVWRGLVHPKEGGGAS